MNVGASPGSRGFAPSGGVDSRDSRWHAFRTDRGVTITSPTLIKRINRRLAHNDLQLRTTRSESARCSIGHHYILNVWRNAIIEMFVDVEDLGRELGVLRPSESLKA